MTMTIDFNCFFCKKDVKADDQVMFDPVINRFAHEDCVNKSIEKEHLKPIEIKPENFTVSDAKVVEVKVKQKKPRTPRKKK